MLKWFVVDNEGIVESALTLQRQIEPEEVCDNAPIQCLDKDVSLARIKKYFQTKAWKFVEELVENVKKCGIWNCPVCLEDTDNGESDAIECDACLRWYHIQCSGLSTLPKKRTWICRNCYKAI